MSFRSTMVTAFCLLSNGPVFAEVIRVCQDGGDYTTIQAGIDAAADGDEVLVCDGVYRGTGNRAIDFRGKAIVVRSEHGPRRCVVDCEGAASGFLFRTGEDERAVVSGFTIVNGRRAGGGGIGIYNTRPTIRNCIIDACSATSFGGGILCVDSSPTVENCLIVRCTSDLDGGGIACVRSDPRIDHCTIVSNLAGPSGNGVHCNDSSPTIRNSILWGNGERSVFVNSRSDPIIEYCIVQGGYVGEGNLRVDPQLTRRLDRLRSGSPCIGAGDPADDGEGRFDIDGEARRLGDRTDIGADEFLDEDVDALADAWEILHFGGIDQADPEADPDGDSRVNLAEFEDSFDPHVSPTTYYVDLGGDDGWDGLAPEYDGTHGPKATLQGGIEAAAFVETDAVVVADGLYRGVGNTNLDLLGKPLTLRSANGARACTIDCQGEGRAFHLHRGESPATTIEGFTLRRGRVIDDQGGALVFCQNSGMTMRACIVEDGEAPMNLKGQYGGGLLLLGGAVRIEDTVVRNNQASYRGSGIYSRGCDLGLIGCRLTGNKAQYSGGGVEVVGGWNVLLADCSITDNESLDDAGGAVVWGTRRSKITDCLFEANHATGGSGGGGGGLMIVGNTGLKVSRCALRGNSAERGGGLRSGGNRNLRVQACTLESNGCLRGGAGAGFHASDDRRTVVSDCTIRANFADYGARGGGVALSEESDIRFVRCRFEDNHAESETGALDMYNSTGVAMEACVFERNSARDYGAIRARSSDLTLRQCRIANNEATYTGAGVSVSASRVRVIDCTVVANRAGREGGGVFAAECDLVVMQSTIAGNSQAAGGLYDDWPNGGGGLTLLLNSRVLIGQSIIADNLATQFGGGILGYDNRNFGIVNCTLSGNRAERDGGGLFGFADRCELVNTVLWGNAAARGTQAAIQNEFEPQRRCVLSVQYSDVEAGEGGIYVGESAELNWGGGNTDRDPKFLSAEDGDYRLGTRSACIDAGSNLAVPADELDLDGDGNTAEPTPFDRDGLARFVNSPCAEDRGEGAPPMVDMGGHEYAGSEENPCPAGSTIRARYGEGGVGVRLSGLLCDRAYTLELRSASGELVAVSVGNTDARGRAEVRFDAVACEGASHRVTLPDCGQEEDVHGGCR